MSELKAYIAPTPDGKGLADYYLKSEADKVIAELEMKLAAVQQVLRLNTPEALYSNLETMSRLSSKINVVARRERHNKYKRCLAMARFCRSCWAANIFIHEGSDRVSAHYMKWEKRWLELSEKFKEAK